MRRGIQTEKWNAEKENICMKQNRKNYKTTNNRKTGIKKKNKQENNTQYYFMFYRSEHDHFLKILLCLDYAGLKETKTLWTSLLSRTGQQPDFQFSQKFRFSFRYQDWNSSGTRTSPLYLGHREARANGCSGQGVKLSTDFHFVPNLKTDGAGRKYCFHVVFSQKVNVTPTFRLKYSVYILNLVTCYARRLP
jgi:hypothetical protein